MILCVKREYFHRYSDITEIIHYANVKSLDYLLMENFETPLKTIILRVVLTFQKSL